VMTKRLLIISTICFGSLFITGCTKVVVQDPEIKAHWMSKGEPAPFDGVLLNDYTYYKLRMKLNECRETAD